MTLGGKSGPGAPSLADVRVLPVQMSSGVNVREKFGECFSIPRDSLSRFPQLRRSLPASRICARATDSSASTHRGFRFPLLPSALGRELVIDLVVPTTGPAVDSASPPVPSDPNAHAPSNPHVGFERKDYTGHRRTSASNGRITPVIVARRQPDERLRFSAQRRTRRIRGPVYSRSTY
jgi:hypothetical protein